MSKLHCRWVACGFTTLNRESRDEHEGHPHVRCRCGWVGVKHQAHVRQRRRWHPEENFDHQIIGPAVERFEQDRPWSPHEAVTVVERQYRIIDARLIDALEEMDEQSIDFLENRLEKVGGRLSNLALDLAGRRLGR